MGFGRFLAAIIGLRAAVAVHGAALDARRAVTRLPRDLAGYAGLLVVLAATCPLRSHLFDRRALRAAEWVADGFDMVIKGPG